MSYPASLDSFTNPSSGDTLASPSHSTQHADANDAIEAIEAKLGTGASTPTTAGHVLTVTGAGASAWQAAGVQSKAIRFTRAATPQTHTGTWTLPAGAVLHDFVVAVDDSWASCTLDINSAAGGNGVYLNGYDLGTDGQQIRMGDMPLLSYSGGFLSGYVGSNVNQDTDYYWSTGLYLPAGDTITAVVVDASGDTSGEFVVTLIWSVPTETAAVVS